jgi:hypothetical protein
VLKQKKPRRPAAEIHAERQAQVEAAADLERMTLENTSKIIGAKVLAARRAEHETARMVTHTSPLAAIDDDFEADLMNVESDEQEPGAVAAPSMETAPESGPYGVVEDVQLEAKGKGAKKKDGQKKVAAAGDPAPKDRTTKKVSSHARESTMYVHPSFQKKAAVLRLDLEERVKVILAEDRDGAMGSVL